jgi:putative PIN family toxin of toxin-antitoxin system
MNLRVVFDTSTLVSAALRPNSVPEQALQRAILFDRLYASRETLGELERVLSLKKFDEYISLESRLEFIEKLRRDSSLSSVPKDVLGEIRGSCRDRKDDLFLAVCIVVQADVLVSSDQDLLVLHPWQGIAILTPARFLAESGV